MLSMLKMYARNRNIEMLSHSLNLLLESDIDRRLLGEIRLVTTVVLASSFSSILVRVTPHCSNIA